MSDEKTDQAVSSIVPLYALGSGNSPGDTLFWDGDKWISTPPVAPTPTKTVASFIPYVTNTVTANGLVGEIRMEVTSPGGNPMGLTFPYLITINNNQLKSADLLFLTIKHNWLTFKENPVWGIVRSVSQGQAAIALLSSTSHPLFGAEDIYIGFNIVKVL
jgi:hypothetical protein